jgi:hypothetical protein
MKITKTVYDDTTYDKHNCKATSRHQVQPRVRQMLRNHQRRQLIHKCAQRPCANLESRVFRYLEEICPKGRVRRSVAFELGATLVCLSRALGVSEKADKTMDTISV